ncbi:M14 family metallopeptidase [Aerococcus sp. L_32]|uniref:M14 family metallopeptidase n=1 Tax=Aerococcus sp. L_32 TaxID=3422316 RepID=UPI003D6AB1B8
MAYENRDYTHLSESEKQNINLIAEAIRHKVYGIDVRESIALAIELMLDIFSKENNDAYAEVVKARNGFGSLDERLDNMLADMQNISVSQINKNLGKIDQTYLTDELIAQIAGTTAINAIPADNSLTTTQFVDKSVTPEKTSFIKKSTNIIPFSNLKYDTALDSSGEISKTGYVTTGYLPLKAFESLQTAYVSSWYSYNSSYGYILPGTGNVPAVGGDRYIRFVFLETYLDKVQVNKGETLLPYESPYGYIIDSMVDGVSIKNGAVTSDKIAENTVTKSKIPLYEIGTAEISDGSMIPEKTNFFKKSSNLFNKNNVTIGNISASTGEYISGTNRISEKIYVDKNADYIYKGSAVRVYFYDRNGKMIKNILNSSADEILKITTTSDTVYLVFVMNFSKVSTLQVNKGATLLDYEDYYVTLKPELLEKTNKHFEFASKEIIGDYFPVTKTQLNIANVDGIDHDSLTVSQLDNLWSTLTTDYPQYVTKTDLGYDASGTFKIYEYDFKPSEIVTARGSKFKELPTILLTGGTHGNGGAGDNHEMLVGLYYFFRDICENWLENEQLYYFKNFVNFKVIPYVNPWGIENRSRKNANGVDINRNTDFGHVVFSDTTRNDYGGTAPWTEPETRYVRDMILANPNAIFYIDFHTTGGNQAQDKLMYCSIHPDSLINYPSMTSITDLSNRWNARNISGLNSGIHGYIVDYASQADLGSWSTKVAGVNGGIIEAFPNFEGSLVESHGAEIMEMAQEEIGQFIWASLKYFKER